MKSVLKICEIFESIQGEGLRVGEPSVFLRLSGCNFKCKYCDTKYSWNEGRLLSVEETVQKIEIFSNNTLVITGGEPLIQSRPLKEMIKMIKDRFRITIETNGSIFERDIFDMIDYISISPKLRTFLGYKPIDYYNNVIKIIKEFTNKVWIKFVVVSDNDLTEIEHLIRAFLKATREERIYIFIQPNSLWRSFNEYLEFTRRLWWKTLDLKKKMDSRVELRFLPQLHKLVFGEEKRGI